MVKIALVNNKDKIVGFESKEKIHKEGKLHRGFSVYILNNQNQLLIQQRSKIKKLWPLYWSNSCCSHPQQNENYIEAGVRRLKEELGFSCSLKMIDKFHYRARYQNIGIENEICAILAGKYNGRVKPNLKEVSNWKWVPIEEIKENIKKNPQNYTPWFKIGLKKFLAKKAKETKQLKKAQKTSKLDSILSIYSKLVEQTIEKFLDSYVDRKHQEIVKYQIFTGGKSLRPALAMIACKLLGGKIKNVLPVAAGLEILHNYSLIIDDIIDDSYLRREKPTTWFKFGNSIAQCVGMDYPAAIFQTVNLSKEPRKIVELFAKTLKTIADGQILDILFEQRGREKEPYVIKNRYQNISEKDYLKMVSRKTAILFQTCCEVGGIVASAKKKELTALRNYGFNLGIAFQVQDDILDIFGEKDLSVKKIGKDIRERKGGNIVILFASKELPKKKREKLLKIMRKKIIKDRDVKEAMKLINQTNSRQKANLFGQKFVETAKENLNLLPQNKWNNILRELADFILTRKK